MLMKKIWFRLRLWGLARKTRTTHREAYDWTAGWLLRKEFTAEDLRGMVRGFDPAALSGALDAIRDYERLAGGSADPYTYNRIDWERDVAL